MQHVYITKLIVIKKEEQINKYIYTQGKIGELNADQA